MPKIQINEIPSNPLIAGYEAQFIHTESATFSHVRAVAGAILPLHAHPHIQASYVLEGEFELTVDGEPHNLVPGQVFVIPSNVQHSGRAITDCFILDVFTPVREDYREKGGLIV
jgi:quercetin dioxygenase-like cupin family protein